MFRINEIATVHKVEGAKKSGTWYLNPPHYIGGQALNPDKDV